MHFKKFMTFFVLSFNYKNINLDIREKLILNPDDILNTYKSLHELELPDNYKITEAILLNTCNRTEIFGILQLGQESDKQKSIVKTYSEIEHILMKWLFKQCSFNKTRINKKLSTFLIDNDAQSHLIKLASGMDSMMIGETQIFGQIKRAFNTAMVSGFIKNNLESHFEHAFYAAKKIRHYSNINDQPISVAYAVGKLLKNKFKNILSEKKVLFVGAGETIALIANYVCQHVKYSTFINRTNEKATKLAKKHANAKHDDFENKNLLLKEHDILITCTSSKDYIFTETELISDLKKLNEIPSMIIDLAVPRDVDFTLSKYSQLLVIDDLEKVLQKALERRKTIARNFNGEIKKFADSFFIKRDKGKYIKKIYQHAKTIEKNWIKNNINNLNLDRKDIKKLKNSVKLLIKSSLYIPTKVIYYYNTENTFSDSHYFDERTKRFRTKPKDIIKSNSHTTKKNNQKI